MNNEDLLPMPELPLPAEDMSKGKYRIAMVIDGVVHQVLLLDAEMAARYLSSPTFVQIPRKLYITPGDKFNGTDFSS